MKVVMVMKVVVLKVMALEVMALKVMAVKVVAVAWGLQQKSQATAVVRRILASPGKHLDVHLTRSSYPTPIYVINYSVTFIVVTVL